ncbi:MAG: carboxymuconolactone decarboxylase family protein [Betaproteobacteria bacterium]
MSKSYVEITDNINRGIVELRKFVPDAMGGFGALSKGALKAGALTEIEKELIAFAIGVAGRCDGCIGFHVKALVRLGVERQQLLETLGVVVYMGGGPALMYAAEAVHAFDEFTAKAQDPAT